MLLRELLALLEGDSTLKDAAWEAFQRLKSHSMMARYGDTDSPTEERGGEYYFGLRDFGSWSNPPEARDDEDYDWQVISQESAKAIKTVLDDVAKKYPTLKFDWSPEEKNWISVRVRNKK